MKLSIKIYLLILTITLMSGCGPKSIKPDTQLIMKAQLAEQANDYASAAKLYYQLASETVGINQAMFYFRSAMAYWSIENSAQAEMALANINFSLLSPAQQVTARLLQAEIALANSQIETALTALTSYSLSDASQQQIIDTLTLRIKAYKFTKNWLEKANNHILLATYLPEQQRLENQEQLWQSLMQLTPQALDLFNPSYPPAIDSGWFALAFLMKSYQDNPEKLMIAFDDWQQSYPNHPADPSLYRDIMKMGTHLPQSISNIAVLLPTKGPYAAAANIIKQGIIAQYYAEEANSKLYFLDTDNDSKNNTVWQRYQEAIQLNADLVIGPLDKKSIEILAAADNLPIPVLALNRITTPTDHPLLFQFGLAPEDDAVATADYAASQGYNRTIIMAPNTSWGRRLADAFTQKWQQHNGVILKQAHYDEGDNDFASIITPVLGLNSSEQRNQSLKKTLNTALEFEPRRRADIDFIFLIARPLKARQLVPQFKFHRSGQLPILTTSHAYQGYDDLTHNIDLNAVIINDIPWVFDDIAQTDPAYMSLKKASDAEFDSKIRLYALGSDSYRLINKLNVLSHDPSQSIKGATGTLSIDDARYIRRTLIPATFVNGKLESLHPNLEHITH